MPPVVTLVGRQNVGKSTLFNCLCGGRDALVGAEPGLTRDRRYGRCHDGGSDFQLVDVGGLDDLSSARAASLALVVREQLEQAVAEAELLLFVVSARDGLLALDRGIAQWLRRSARSWWLVVNKVDGLDADLIRAEFSPLAAAREFLVAATHRRGTAELRSGVARAVGRSPPPLGGAETERFRVAVIGRPNAGKSTLLNRLLGERRMVVDEQPGATRDSIAVPVRCGGRDYTLVDTAGLRRRGNRVGQVEQLAAMKALDAVRGCHAALLMVDATQGVVEQDLHLLGQVLAIGRPVVVALSKWDAVASARGLVLRAELRRRLVFADFVPCLPLSAHSGHGIGALLAQLEAQRAEAQRAPGSAAELNRILRQVVAERAPPLSGRHRIQLRHAHPGGNRPPCIVIHGSQACSTPTAYRRYLERRFRAALALASSPLKLLFRDVANPYAERPNRLTPRQRRRRQRLLRHVR